MQLSKVVSIDISFLLLINSYQSPNVQIGRHPDFEQLCFFMATKSISSCFFLLSKYCFCHPDLEGDPFSNSMHLGQRRSFLPKTIWQSDLCFVSMLFLLSFLNNYIVYNVLVNVNNINRNNSIILTFFRIFKKINDLLT